MESELKNNQVIALRMDDVGASSKIFEVYSKVGKGLGNILFLKFLPGFKAWGPYREMNGSEWEKIIELLKKENCKLTVAITAAWVEFSGSLTPFPEKFRDEADVIKSGVKSGVLEIAIHGLTHCQTHNKLFRPKFFRGNRQYHREFLPELPYEWHLNNIKRAKDILEKFFEVKIDLLIPPGNLYGDHTINACEELGINIINCRTDRTSLEKVKIISNKQVLAFHDKEIVEFGVKWLAFEIEKIKQKGHSFCFISELSP